MDVKRVRRNGLVEIDKDVERVKKKMITRAIAWVEWNNRYGSCLFDGWKESLREAMKGE